MPKIIETEEDSNQNLRYPVIIDSRSENVIISESDIIVKGIKNKVIKVRGTDAVWTCIHANTLVIQLWDNDGKEINPLTKIVISKEWSSGSFNISNTYYTDVNNIRRLRYWKDYQRTEEVEFYTTKDHASCYRFPITFIIREDEYLKISFVPNDEFSGKISKEKAKFKLECDIEVIKE